MVAEIPAGKKAAEEETSGKQEAIRLAYSGKGEYMEMFSLLPLEKFNLDRFKPEETKKEDELKRRYRLIPCTFPNWLQAFAIMASVIGEKTTEPCSALFCYLNAMGEAYRVYRGTAWLQYDE